MTSIRIDPGHQTVWLVLRSVRPGMRSLGRGKPPLVGTASHCRKVISTLRSAPAAGHRPTGNQWSESHVQLAPVRRPIRPPNPAAQSGRPIQPPSPTAQSDRLSPHTGLPVRNPPYGIEICYSARIAPRYPVPRHRARHNSHLPHAHWTYDEQKKHSVLRSARFVDGLSCVGQ